VNYGAIGGVIGQEIGHGFDDQGSKYDGDGVLRNWWTDEDLARFRELGQALAEQYDTYCPLDEADAPCVNGKLSLGENIGDLGGLSLAYRAYQLSLNGEEAPVIDGLTGDQRFGSHWKFMLEGRPEVYLQRVLDHSTTTQGYTVEDIMAGKYGEPGAALMLFRTYPRVAFYEQVYDHIPFYTDTGRMNAYVDLPEAIEYGENLISHREPPEATPYLPNVIVSSSPYVRPHNYGIPPEMLQAGPLDADLRAVANNKLPWAKVKNTKNPLWHDGYTFYAMTPKSRHTTHSSWATVDWNWIWSTNFGDPYRMDKRQPGVSDWQVHMNPQAGKDLGIEDGDYIYVDANPVDRPFGGWDDSDPRYKAFRLLTRVKYNPAYPYHVVMTKHSAWIASERTVKAHETRPDGRALAADTGYQSNFRYGSHQSITRGWAPPMHQTDGLFHKKVGSMAFTFGFDVDNHAVNTVPKETLVRIQKAEPGGRNGEGVWEPVKTGYTPGHENTFMARYVNGTATKVKGAK